MTRWELRHRCMPLRATSSGFLFAKHYGPKTSLLELTGDCDAGGGAKLAEEAFGKWASSGAVPAARRLLRRLLLSARF
jgi:predicted Zn-dependent peptidase